MTTRKSFIFSLCSIILLFCSISQADQEYEFLLEDFRGEILENRRTFTIPIDLETSFEKIKKVSIYLTGYATPGEATSTEGDNDFIETPVSFQIKILDKVTPGYGSLLTPVVILGPFDADFKIEKKFKVLSGGQRPDWNFLCDGYAEIKFSWKPACQEGCTFVKNRFLDIKEAVLIIKGIEAR